MIVPNDLDVENKKEKEFLKSTEAIDLIFDAANKNTDISDIDLPSTEDWKTHFDASKDESSIKKLLKCVKWLVKKNLMTAKNYNKLLLGTLNGRYVHYGIDSENVVKIKLLILDNIPHFDLLDEECRAKFRDFVRIIVSLSGTVSVLNKLISLGAPVDMTGEHLRTSKVTLLMLAFESDKLEMVHSLLTTNVDVKAIDSEGRTALHYACHYRPEINVHRNKMLVMEMARLLLENGADVNSAFYAGLVSRRIELARLLLGAKASVLGRSYHEHEKHTYLQIAVFIATLNPLIPELLAAGGHADLINEDGTTLAQCAKSEKRTELTKLLKVFEKLPKCFIDWRHLQFIAINIEAKYLKLFEMDRLLSLEQGKETLEKLIVEEAAKASRELLMFYSKEFHELSKCTVVNIEQKEEAEYSVCSKADLEKQVINIITGYIRYILAPRIHRLFQSDCEDFMIVLDSTAQGTMNDFFPRVVVDIVNSYLFCELPTGFSRTADSPYCLNKNVDALLNLRAMRLQYLEERALHKKLEDERNQSTAIVRFSKTPAVTGAASGAACITAGAAGAGLGLLSATEEFKKEDGQKKTR